MSAESESMHEIASACVRECLRQQVGVEDLAQLLKAYSKAMNNEYMDPPELATRHLTTTILAVGVPAKRLDAFDNWPLAYRTTPVTFANGHAGLDAREVPDAMRRLFEALDDDTDPAEFVRAFLSIHPFSDGNGRTAFILFNWLSGTLDHPQALPDFNWDD